MPSVEQEVIEAFLEATAPPKPVFSPDELLSFRRFAHVSGIMPEGPGGQRFSLEGRPWLEPLYEQTRGQEPPRLVVIKAAQLGLTIFELMFATWKTADTRQRFNHALMFPTQDAVEELHATRFRPMVQSSARMMQLLGSGGVNQVRATRFGVSVMRFRGVQSGVSVDSFPTDGMAFDEVRLMPLATIQRAMLRVSASRFESPEGHKGIIHLGSTAGFPKMDIDYFWQLSDKHEYLTLCPNRTCTNHKGFVLADAWPHCVDFDRMGYMCPICKSRIENVQQGGFVRTGEAGAPWRGYRFSKTLLGDAYLPEMLRAYRSMVEDGKNPGEFYNSYLGQTHQDPNAVLVTRDVYEAAKSVDPAYTWPEPGLGHEFTACGIDQRGVEKHLVFAFWRDGRIYLKHLHILEASGKKAIDEAASLIRYWGANIVVSDAEPSYDFATGLGRALPKGMVWLADYDSNLLQPIEWIDERDKEKIKRSSGEAKYEYWVRINRYTHLLQAFTLWQNYKVVLPVNAAAKVQELRRDGAMRPVVMSEEFAEHLSNIAKIQVPQLKKLPTGEVLDTGESRYTFRHLALDPHFAHAWGFCVAGLMRKMGTTQFVGGINPPEETYQGSVSQLRDLQPAKLATKGKPCATCRYFTPPDSGALGLCSNARKAQAMGVMGGKLRTLATSTGCTLHRT